MHSIPFTFIDIIFNFQGLFMVVLTGDKVERYDAGLYVWRCHWLAAVFSAELSSGDDVAKCAHAFYSVGHAARAANDSSSIYGTSSSNESSHFSVELFHFGETGHISYRCGTRALVARSILAKHIAPRTRSSSRSRMALNGMSGGVRWVHDGGRCTAPFALGRDQ